MSLDDLLHFDQRPGNIPPPPRGKHVFGVVQMGDRGQIVIPKRARELFGLAFSWLRPETRRSNERFWERLFCAMTARPF